MPPFAYPEVKLLGDRWQIEIVQSFLDADGQRPSAYLEIAHLTATIQWRGVGSGTLELAPEDPGYMLAQEGNYVVLTDYVSGFHWDARIVHILQDRSDARAEQKTCTLADLRWLPYAYIATNAGAWSTGSFTPALAQEQIIGPTETAAKVLVAEQCGSILSLASPVKKDPFGTGTPVVPQPNPQRQIPNFRVAIDQQRGSSQTVNVTGEPLSQLITQILAVDDYGDVVRLEDDYTLTYDVLVGNDLTATAAVPGAIQQVFSADLENVSSLSYEHGSNGTVNAVLVIGAAPLTSPGTTPATGDPLPAPVPVVRPELWVEDAFSIALHGRIEATIDAADADTADEMETAGRMLMAQKPQLNRIAFIALEQAASRFGLDWNVGDLCTVDAAFSDGVISQDLRIQSVQVTVGAAELRSDAAPRYLDFQEVPATIPLGMVQLVGGEAEAQPPDAYLLVRMGTEPAVQSDRKLSTKLLR